MPPGYLPPDPPTLAAWKFANLLMNQIPPVAFLARLLEHMDEVSIRAGIVHTLETTLGDETSQCICYEYVLQALSDMCVFSAARGRPPHIAVFDQDLLTAWQPQLTDPPALAPGDLLRTLQDMTRTAAEEGAQVTILGAMSHVTVHLQRLRSLQPNRITCLEEIRHALLTEYWAMGQYLAGILDEPNDLKHIATEAMEEITGQEFQWWF
jgi:hypothetical protein